MKLSLRAQSLKPSPTLALASKAKELQAQGKDVISLTVGEPDWDTFVPGKEAGIKAIQAGFTKYTAAAGIPELRARVAQMTTEQLGVTYQPNQIVVGAGAKFMIYSSLQLILNPGDEVLVPTPYWVSYPTMVELAGGVAKIVETSAANNFKLQPQDLESTVTPRTRALILCSPSNPTGILYSTEELRALAKALLKYPELWILSDDIYNRLLWTGDRIAPHLLHVAPELQSRMIAINGASKAYAMTGWRVGWSATPTVLAQALSDFMSQTTSNVSSISQKAALASIEKCEPEILKIQTELESRYRFCEAELSKLTYFRLVRSQGAFYLWVDIRSLLGKTLKGRSLQTSKDLAEVLLQDFLVATVPGAEFGSEGYLRLSFAASRSELSKAFQRFKDFESQLS
ncbi:MAG: pyridoxal phosphate-dependent aminotransferase [Proteobacteria bacterium]|nr:pyridoxal phosphate-dependent aminotransferase [Pseudomonadota bacterium]